MIELVYLVGPVTNYPGSLTKIGTTSDIDRRLRDFQSGSPVELAVLWAVPGGFQLEQWLHARFAEERRHGEWFDLGSDPVGKVQGILGPFLENVISSQAITFPRTTEDPSFDIDDQIEDPVSEVQTLISLLKQGEELSSKRAADLLDVSRATGGRRLAEARAALYGVAEETEQSGRSVADRIRQMMDHEGLNTAPEVSRKLASEGLRVESGYVRRVVRKVIEER